MTTTIEPHPDKLSDWIKTKEIRRGGRRAIENAAIKDYHRALDEGKSRAEAEKEYFKHFNTGYGASRNTMERA